MRVKFTDDYDHTWPSRAMTHFPAGHEGSVKREVGEAAVAAGKAKEVPSLAEQHAAEVAKPAPRKRGRKPKAVAETLPGNLPADLAEPQALTPNMGVDTPADSQ